MKPQLLHAKLPFQASDLLVALKPPDRLSFSAIGVVQNGGL
jgi:hypothetical protein